MCPRPFIVWLASIEPDTWQSVIETVPLVAVAVVQIIWMAKTINASRESTHQELRAYLHISKEDIPGLDALNLVLKGADDVSLKETIVYRFKFKNFGRTPAHDVLVDVKTVVNRYPASLKSMERWDKLNTRTDVNDLIGDLIFDGSIGPDGGSGIPVRFSNEITPEEIVLLNLGIDDENFGHAIFVYGQIQYLDAFSKTQRITNFCFSHYKRRGNDVFVDELEMWIKGNKAT